MSGWLMFAAFAAICGINAALGWHWSRLDHNPWTGKFLGGGFSGPSPGINPGALSVEEVRRRGRQLLLAQPFVFVIGAFFIFVITAR